MNVYDSEMAAALLQPLGYAMTDDPASADLILLNTCAIREKAEQKAFSFLGRLANLKDKNPELIIGVGGCMAQQEGKEILRRIPFIDIIFGTRAIRRLPQMIEQVADRRCRIIDVEMADEIDPFLDTKEGCETDTTAGSGEPNGRVTRFVTIMQGCDNFCAYCVVPYVRGREQSRRAGYIIREIETLVRSGVREVTLLGQNVNSYGRKEDFCTFAELLARINDIEGLYRIRFTTSHPKDLSEDLIAAFRNLDKLCHHIHLPVQAGSDAVLKRMNRKYTREQYLRKVETLRQVCPDIAITTDIIVGFPGETEADFAATLDMIRTVAYDGLFSFKYSDRPNAPATRFSQKVPEAEQNRRLQTVQKLQEEYTLRKNRALIGTRQAILVDGFSKYQDRMDGPGNGIQWTGRTSGNKIVNFSCSGEASFCKSLLGRMIEVEIENAFPHSLRGKPVKRDNLLKGEDTYAA